MGALLLLAGRAVQLAFSGDPSAAGRQQAAAQMPRADIVDRNGVLLATTIRAYTLTARPDRVWDAPATAAALLRQFPDLDRAATLRRLTDRSRDLVFLRRDLTERDRAAVLDLGLAGLGFENEERRVYPNGALAGHVLGYTNTDLKALAGVERGLDRRIAQGRQAPVRLSIDARIQHAAEAELDAAARISRAEGGAVIVLDGRTGETLALASWPALDPNRFASASAAAQRNRASGERYEMGSTIKAFTVATALELGLARMDESFDLASPMIVDGHSIVDDEPMRGPGGLNDILIHSSNKGAAKLALRIGSTRFVDYLRQLGLLQAAPLQIAETAPPLPLRLQSQLDVATLGFGYGLGVSPTAMAGAYTVFANHGARVSPTLLALKSGDPVTRTPVYSAETTRAVLGLLRAVVRSGTGREADVPGLAIAGKTGTAEKIDGAANYDSDRMFSSFAAIFPAFDPRYVIVLSLDEPARTAATGGRATGGAVAAAPVGRIAARIAPMLGLRVETRDARAPAPR
ncbi:MAG: peptidoglycan D,D-transpeptidase FtsI family protein [Hyphomonadaceae bacterium]